MKIKIVDNHNDSTLISNIANIDFDMNSNTVVLSATDGVSTMIYFREGIKYIHLTEEETNIVTETD